MTDIKPGEQIGTASNEKEELDDLQKFLASQEQSEIPLIEIPPTFLEEGVITAPAHKCRHEQLMT